MKIEMKILNLDLKVKQALNLLLHLKSSMYCLINHVRNKNDHDIGQGKIYITVHPKWVLVGMNKCSCDQTL